MYLFGIGYTRRALPRRKIQAAIAQTGWKGVSFHQIDEHHDSASNGCKWKHWFSGPNAGEPFDSSMAREVIAAVRAAGY